MLACGLKRVQDHTGDGEIARFEDPRALALDERGSILVAEEVGREREDGHTHTHTHTHTHIHTHGRDTR